MASRQNPTPDFVQYDFGSNWWSFVEGHLTDERIAEARRSLTEFLGMEDLRGRSFLDIGCGSGLFSLAAHLLGAERVVSLDVNPNSVRCCNALRQRAGDPPDWTILEGSILDRSFVDALEPADIVYSWGVLHHTGDMNEAIRNAASRVGKGGLFYIAIYNTADGIGIYSDGRIGSSRFWELEKRWYVSAPAPVQKAVDGLAAAGMILTALLRLRNPVRMIREHQSLRGMSFMVDIRDWLGGYPYEHATVDEIFSLVHGELGMGLRNLRSTNSLMNNEFLFERAS
jgi:SAM-dependent methyltransferase